MGEFILHDPSIGGMIARFEHSLRVPFQQALERAGHYSQRIAAVLEREGVPAELAYLPLIESGYRPDARSRQGALGLWQLVRATAQRYGLRVDAYVDERRDPIRSTRAAARYLRHLYARFGSWQYSLAAYDLGPSRLTRLLSRHGVQTDADCAGWRSLPPEARTYLARFAAALQIVRAPERHGFIRPQRLPVRYDVVPVPGSVSVREVAAMAGVLPAAIAELNPALLRGITPPDRRAYPVRLPLGARRRFELACARERRGAAPALSTPRVVTSSAANRSAAAAVLPPPHASRPSGITLIVAPGADAVRRG